MQRRCLNCGKLFITNKNAQKHCSADCRREYTKKNGYKKGTLKVLNCAYCGETFHTLHKCKYCSTICRQKANGRYVKKSRPKKASLSLEAIAKLARAEGLSYGQYVMKYGI